MSGPASVPPGPNHEVRDRAENLSRPARRLLVQTFASRGRPDAASVSTNTGPRLCWETLEEGGIVRSRAPSIFHRFNFELTPFGRSVLLELLKAKGEPAAGVAPEPERPRAVRRECPDCRKRLDCRVLHKGKSWVECPSCGHSWSTRFRRTEIV